MTLATCSGRPARGEAGARPVDRARIVAFAPARGNRFGRWFTTSTCEVARATARRLRLSDEVQRSLYHFCEAFNGNGGPAGVRGEPIPFAARIARIASVAALFDRFGGETWRSTRCTGVPEACSTRRSSLPSSRVRQTSWRRQAQDLPGKVVVELEPEPMEVVAEPDLADVAGAFADVADLKSPFMHDDSQRVANLARDTAGRLGLGTSEARDVHVAALVR
jgi:response regulator RpfG family c-di-GMP phosphodiesterase